MKQLILVASLMIYGLNLRANHIEVPEDCVNRVTPCLVKADSKVFKFQQAKLEITLQGHSILKISQDQNHISLDILKGYVAISTVNPPDLTVSINGVMVDDQKYFAQRHEASLKIFDLKKFVLTDYKLETQGGEFPVVVKSTFLNKNDLVEFTRYYHRSVAEFKSFLNGIEKNWVTEFKIENENQTKVLLRSIASVEKKAEMEEQKKIRKERELKKVKNDFFFRTFQR